MLPHVEVENGLAIVRMGPRAPGARDLPDLRALVQRLVSQGIGGVLFDMAAVKRLPYAGIAALLELTSSPIARFGLCQLQPAPQERLHQSGIAKSLPLYQSIEDARKCERFQGLRLTGYRAVILSAGKGSRVAPLTDETPKPMLDLLGRPVLEHIVNHLQSFGVRDFLINPGHLGPQIPAHFKRRRDVSIFYAHEGRAGPEGWHGAPIGSASTLARLQHRHSAFSDDTIVMCGDALIDLDMADLMQAHRASGAEVTIAAKQVALGDVEKYGIIVADDTGRVARFQEKPTRDKALSTLANVGVYVISPRAVGRLSDKPGLDIAADLLPMILHQGGHVQVHAPAFSWVDIGCGRDYYGAASMVLRNEVPGVVPHGREIRPGVWMAEGARVSTRARIDGPCYIGPNADVRAGCEITGPCVIGANAVIETRVVIRNSLIRPDVRVASGAFVDSMIAGPNWAVDHRLADGSLQNRSRLDRVQALDGEFEETRPSTQPIARIA